MKPRTALITELKNQDVIHIWGEDRVFIGYVPIPDSSEIELACLDPGRLNAFTTVSGDVDERVPLLSRVGVDLTNPRDLDPEQIEPGDRFLLDDRNRVGVVRYIQEVEDGLAAYLSFEELSYLDGDEYDLQDLITNHTYLPPGSITGKAVDDLLEDVCGQPYEKPAAEGKGGFLPLPYFPLKDD